MLTVLNNNHVNGFEIYAIFMHWGSGSLWFDIKAGTNMKYPSAGVMKEQDLGYMTISYNSPKATITIKEPGLKIIYYTNSVLGEIEFTVGQPVTFSVTNGSPYMIVR